MQMQEGARRFGVETVNTEVTAVFLDQPVKAVVTPEGMYKAPVVIIATGADHKHLGIAREEELTGRGVAYCAACDGMFYRGKTVAVVGGGNSAAADAAVLSRVAEKVYLIHRRDKLRADRVYHKPLAELKNLEFVWNSEVSELIGQEQLEAVSIRHKDGSSRELTLDGLFVSVGRKPVTELFAGQLALDENGYIIADESTRTSLPGVFAVGDVRTKAVRQIVTATADGAVAAHYAENYLLTAE
jgi:thioredoxin reductase (NADPH)